MSHKHSKEASIKVFIPLLFYPISFIIIMIGLGLILYAVNVPHDHNHPTPVRVPTKLGMTHGSK